MRSPASQLWAGFDTTRLIEALRAAGPPLLFGLRMWASVCLALYVAFWLELDNAYWAGTSAAIVCQPHLGASLRKGWFRMIGTVVGAIAIVVLTAAVPQDRALFLVGLALWGAVCALVATLLRNFAAYAAALAGYTAAIIASDQLGATGGVNGAAFTLAVTRATEICIGIVSAGVVLAVSDLGGTRRRLAALFADLAAGITAGFMRTLTLAGPQLPDTQPVRREFLRRVIALDPVIDEARGESSQLRYHSPVLQRAVDGFFAALAGWRAAANHLVRLAQEEAAQQAAAILERMPQELRSLAVHAAPTRWISDPAGLHGICEAAAYRLVALPAATPSLRLLADKTAEALLGISDALNGLALLTADPARPVPRWPSTARLRVPEWLPAFINGGRAFITIGAVAVFWIVTAWPSGAEAVAFAAIDIILLAPRADQAYAAAIGFALGTFLAAACAAVIKFAILPGLETDTFAAFAIVMGLYLIPTGALIAQPWQTVTFTAMTANFVPLLGPANPMSYNTVQFYNAASAIVAGTVAAALAFRLMPPLSPPFRTRRLLALTLRDLRRLAMGRSAGDWEGHVHGRLSVLPEGASPLQRAQLLAALSVGSEIIRLRPIARRFDVGNNLDTALAWLAHGNSATAIGHLARLDAALASRTSAAEETQTVLRARASIIVLSEVLTQHAAYFEAGAC